jgi:hypothetical protein
MQGGLRVEDDVLIESILVGPELQPPFFLL